METQAPSTSGVYEHKRPPLSQGLSGGPTDTFMVAQHIMGYPSHLSTSAKCREENASSSPTLTTSQRVVPPAGPMTNGFPGGPALSNFPHLGSIIDRSGE